MALLAAGCGGGDLPYAETVRLKLGQTRTLDGGTLTMALVKIADSRCPKNVVCVTAGKALIDVAVDTLGEAPATIQMTLLPGGAPLVYHYGPYRMEFADLTPYPSDPPPADDEYEAKIVVRRD